MFDDFFKNSKKRFSLLVLAMIAHLGSADYRGSVTMSNTQIEATDVTYTFDLRFQSQIKDASGKLVLRFPPEFEESFQVTGCTAKSGFKSSLTSGSPLTCEWVASVRLLTITQAFPSSIVNNLIFDVKGVTNPQYAAITEPFQIDSYKMQGGEFVSLESSASTIVIKPAPGAISKEAMSLKNPTVGAYSDMTVQFQSVHDIPATGRLEINFPKWNDLATNSYVATSTSPGTVPCTALANIALLGGRQLTCIFQHGKVDFNGIVQSDTLAVIFDDNVVSDLIKNTLISFSVSGVRGPPSTSPVSGFTFRTLTKNGDLIDQSEATSSIVLVASTPNESNGSNMEVTSDDPSINTLSSLTLRVITGIPLKPLSNIEITIPNDFGVDSISSITTLGGYLEPNPSWSFNAQTRTLNVQKINKIYLDTRESLYIVVQRVRNPSQTTPTSSFYYQLLDPNNSPIEFAGKGILFTATAGGFGDISVTAADKLINKIDVQYTFTMRPQDLFSNRAVVKIVCPTQVYVNELATVVSGTTDLVTPVDSATEVLFNRIIYVRNAFKSGLQQLQSFDITLNGFTNPATTQATDSFHVSILYEEAIGESEISVYVGNGLVIEALPSTALKISATMTEKETGQMQTEFIISGSMELLNSIEKQAYIKVDLPAAFTIVDYDRVASTCTRLTGFSDEINCSFEANLKPQTTLVVKGGFDSVDFKQKEFSFKIAEIMNPLSTIPTDTFDLQIYDRTGGLMYTANNKVELTSIASEFAFVHVKSQNPINGVKSIYQVTITLEVATAQEAFLEFTVPDEISFEDTSVCRGTKNLAENLNCVFVSERTRRINLKSNDPAKTDVHESGTTIQFDIGYLKNPFSLSTTSFFQLSTYTEENGKKYMINESKNQVFTTNETPGPITLKKAVTSNTELGAETDIELQFETQSKMPQASKMIITLPTNIVIEKTKTQMYINDILVGPTVNADAKQFVVNNLPVDGTSAFTVKFEGGLKNPTIGPYNYEYMQIEFMDQADNPIDKKILNEPFIVVPCTNNCDSCKDTLSKCTSCKYNAALEKSYYLKASEFKCLDDCGSGFFEDTGYKCSPCEGNCLECSVSATSCTLCKAGTPQPFADPLSLQCYDTCPAGTFLDSAKRQCMPCVSPCYTCSSLEQCTACDRTDPDNTYIFFNSKESRCFQECPATSVPTPSKNCNSCIAPCETCELHPDQCTSCTESSYLHKNNECVSECPFLYFSNDDTRKCTYFGELALPLPFTIIAFVVSVGVGISAFVKGADREGREQEGTAFFVTMLALVDILLRLNWAVLAYIVFQKDFYVTFGLLLTLIALSFFINLYLWRRYFQDKYRYEESDPLFSAYCKRNPVTAQILIFLSFLISFQVVRLTYSRFMGKKRFFATFTRRLRYFRLIGRLTVLETLMLYLPAIIINSWSLTAITDQKTSQFWLNLDGLLLVCYAVILISIVLTQRESLMNYKSYFKFSELFNFGDDADTDQIPEEVMANTGQAFTANISARGDDQSAANVPVYHRQEQLEVRSATAYDDLHRKDMYQLEERYGSLDEMRGWGEDEAAAAVREQYMRAKWWNDANRDRSVSVIDYQEYRKLQDKRDRIMLKKTLYEKKKVGDEEQVVLLNDELNKYQNHKKGLNSKLVNLKKQLKELQKNVVQVDKTRKKEVQEVEQEKRRDIIRRQGREVPYQSHSGITSSKIQNRDKSANAKGQPEKAGANSPAPPRGAPANGRVTKKKRGGRQHQQSKSPNQLRQQDQQDQPSLNVLQPGQQISEPMGEGEFQNQTQAEAAIAMQAALVPQYQESQVETEKADDMRRPNLDQESSEQVEFDQAQQETEPISGYPRMEHNLNLVSQETEPAGPEYPRMDNAAATSQEETEPADNMQRPIDTLATEEVEGRVDDAAMAESADGRESIESPNLGSSPNPNKQ